MVQRGHVAEESAPQAFITQLLAFHAHDIADHRCFAHYHHTTHIPFNRGCISDAVEKGWFRGQAGGGGSRGALQGGESSVESSFTGGLSSAAPDMGAILATAREVAAAMSYLHHNNMLHGDLTGNNVLLTAAPGEKRGYTAKVRKAQSGDQQRQAHRLCGLQ